MGTTAFPAVEAKTKPPLRARSKHIRQQVRRTPARVVMVPVEVPELNFPFSDLPYDDGVPLESNWHRAEMSLLIESYQQHRHPQRNFYTGGNMFVYYSSQQALNRDYRGPDFFVVLNVDGEIDRKSWIVWEEEGRYPNVIIELMSASTANVDKTTKKDLYAHTFATQNYFYYDPQTRDLKGFHLVEGEYEDLTADERGYLWCEALGLWVGLWQGEFQGHTHHWIRFYDQDGNLVLTGKEAEAQRADLETQRAEAAQEELNRLHARLREMGIDPGQL